MINRIRTLLASPLITRKDERAVREYVRKHPMTEVMPSAAVILMGLEGVCIPEGLRASALSHMVGVAPEQDSEEVHVRALLAIRVLLAAGAKAHGLDAKGYDAYSAAEEMVGMTPDPGDVRMTSNGGDS